MDDFREKTILLVTHSRASGLPQILRDWLKEKVKSLVFIDHPLLSSEKTRSIMTLIQPGRREKVFLAPSFVAPSVLVYLKDFLLTIFFVFKSGQKFELAIGVDPLNTFPLLLLQKLGRIKKVIYHTVDYTPQRFANPLLNKIYHLIDRICCYKADLLWNSSGRMNEARFKNGVQGEKIRKTIITPDGSNFDAKKRLPIEKIDRGKIVFLGHLREGLGLPLIIDAMVQVLKRQPLAKLLVIGGGPLLPKLKEQVKKENLEKAVTLTGFIENHEEVDDLLKTAAIGLSPFEPKPDALEYYSDVGKPKVYLTAGQPVIITKVPEIALEIEKEKAGIVIDYNKKALADAIVSLLSDEKLYREMRESAIDLSKKYQWENIFSQAFKESFSYLNEV